MRLDYAKIIPYLEYLTDRISELISEEENSIEANMLPGDTDDISH
jgi:hypothetical protein